MIYIFSCGCNLNETQIVYNRQKTCCPDHPDSTLINRQTECEGCGCIMKQNSNGRIQKRCKACQRKQNNKKRKEYNQKRREGCIVKTKRASFKATPKRKPDCKYYSDCLDVVHGRLMKNSGACIDCPYYETGAELNILDYMRADGEQLNVNYA
ncbi:MAG: hypothetical protein U9N34_10000 [Candidatus Cloacimonadota bacterium]|nr:hypothetical protein [Candidatus Cloacimonadota bacterium]